jgi:hypothetical protein
MIDEKTMGKKSDETIPLRITNGGIDASITSN